MKKTKKLVALVLAMVMAFSLMAVTAAAYGAEDHDHDGVCCEETVEPRVQSPPCSNCGEGMERRGTETYDMVVYIVYVCPACGNKSLVRA